MLAPADHEISRFPSKERAHMSVSKTTPGRLGARTIGVGAVRYSFIVMDLHHLLLAGLPAHSGLPRWRYSSCPILLQKSAVTDDVVRPFHWG
jgi:hypothetical protein